MRSTDVPRQREPDIHAVPSASSRRVTSWVRSSLPKLAHTWEKNDVVLDGSAVDPGDARGEAGGVPAVAVDEGRQAGAAEGAHDRPDGDAAGAAGDFGDELERVARRVPDQVLPVHPHGGAQRGTVPDDRDSAVVGDVEGLVRVGGPRIGCLIAGDEVPGPRGRRREQAERAVDMHPGAVPASGLDRGTEGVERTGMDVARLQDHDRRAGAAGRPGPRRQRRFERIGIDAALVVGGDDFGRAEAEVTQRQVDGVVPFRADEHPDPRRPGQPVGGDLPACLVQHRVPRGGQAGEVGHRGAGDEADPAACGQPEHVEQPALRHVLDRGERGCRQEQARVLVPGADQPVGGQGRRVRAADDEPVEPARRHRGEAGLAGPGEEVDDLRRFCRAVRQAGAERGGDLGHGGLRRDGPGSEAVEPLRCVARRAGERDVTIWHGPKYARPAAPRSLRDGPGRHRSPAAR